MNSKKKRGQADGQYDLLGSQLSFAASEAYKLLRTNLMFALPDNKAGRVVGITSSVGGEGKSTTAINLAYSLAEDGKRVLLVESDMRLPTVAKRLDLKRAPGLSNLLAGMPGSGDAIQRSGMHDNFMIMPSGDVPPNPSELLGSAQMQEMIRLVSQKFDYILLDLPPVNVVSDPLVASKLTDGILFVVREGYTSRNALNAAVQKLKFADAKLLGFVMTDAGSSAKKHYGSYGKGYGKYSKGYGRSYAYSTSLSSKKVVSSSESGVAADD